MNTQGYYFWKSTHPQYWHLEHQHIIIINIVLAQNPDIRIHIYTEVMFFPVT